MTDNCSGAWKDASFKQYNFAAAGQPTEGGALHPLLKVREEMRQIFFDMGYVGPSRQLPRTLVASIRMVLMYACRFTEMPTNRFVESAFWNFDAMFVPQQHPAREMQDTFYVKGRLQLALLMLVSRLANMIRPRQGTPARRGLLPASARDP
jgi:phenylalanyl-tRNA synthetase alpha chain